MHEASLVSALLARIEREAAPRMAQHTTVKVRRVEIDLGELAGVEAELFASAWDVFRIDTCCDSAELVIAREAARWQCPRCGGETPSGRFLRCPTCNMPAKLVAGGDVMLRRIEMEVSDV